MNKEKISNFIKRSIGEADFLFCGISESAFLSEDADNLENWLKKSCHGRMLYMENNFDKRLNPSLLVDGAHSVISVAYNYYTQKELNPKGYKIAKYAFGEDYHEVIKKKLKQVVEEKLIPEIGNFTYRIFVDSAPVMERSWARRSGLGWIGKNSLLLNKNYGSYFFLAEIISDLKLNYDFPLKTDHCGTCTRCIDACPTQAIIAPKKIDSRRCISYLTIELKGEMENLFKGKLDNWIFGCDICQNVCPWNRFSIPHSEPLFEPSKFLLDMNKENWKNLQEETFKKLFKKSPIKRTKYSGIMRNISSNNNSA